MNNQYNPQQPAPQQTTSTQTVQQAPPQQTTSTQTVQQAPPQQNFQQPNQQFQYQQQYQQAYAPRPPKPRIDPAIAHKQKKDAIEAFGDKLSALMNTNPFLRVIAKIADLISYGITGICVIFTIIALIASNVNMVVLTLNLGGEVGGCFIFSILAVIFGGLSLCKKKMLPLTISLSAVTALLFTRFIVNIVTFATLGSLASEMNVSTTGASFPGGIVINFIFLIIEMLAVGFLTYICWTYFLATLPPRPVMQQPYQQPYNPQQNMQQNYQQAVAPQQNPVQQAAPVQPVAPQQVPVQQAPVQQMPVQQAPVQQAPVQQVAPQQATAPVSTICPNCQTVNGADSIFCQKCGTKLK